jgi:HPr kinase/phosphorylase
MVLRLLDLGFMLVADDRVDVVDGYARPADSLAGLLEVRGLGILRLPYVAPVRLRLAVTLGTAPDRLPEPAWHDDFSIRLLTIDPARPSAAQRAALALDCAVGRVRQLAGAFA